MTVSYGWRAPAWTLADAYEEFYENDARILMCCAVLEELRPDLEGRASVLRHRGSNLRPSHAVPKAARRVDALIRRIDVALERASAHFRTAAEVIDVNQRFHHAGYDLQNAFFTECRQRGATVEELNELFRFGHDERELIRAARRTLRRYVDAATLRTLETTWQPLLREATEAGTALRRTGRRDPFTMARRLEHRLIDLVREAMADCTPKARWVPRHAPGAPQGGSFHLPLATLVDHFDLVRLLMRTDEVLADCSPDVYARLLPYRQSVATLLEDCAIEDALDAAERAAARVEVELHDAVLKVCMMLKRPLPDADVRDAATELLAELAGRTAPAAREWCARLSNLLALPATEYQPRPLRRVSATEAAAMRALERELGSLESDEGGS